MKWEYTKVLTTKFWKKKFSSYGIWRKFASIKFSTRSKNGKGKAKIYVNDKNPVLSDKARNLGGYVVPFSLEEDIVNKILQDNPDIL